MFKFTLEDVIAHVLKLYQNNIRYNDRKCLCLLNKIIMQLLAIHESQRRKIFTFNTESEAVEYIHASYLTNIAATQIAPIQKIITALKMQYHCNYTPYKKSKRRKSKPISIPPKITQYKRRKSQPISIPPLPKQRRQPKKKQSTQTKPKNIFKNATHPVQKFYEVVALLLQIHGIEHVWKLMDVLQICAITFRLSTADIAPVKRIVFKHGSIANVASGKYIISSDIWTNFLMHMKVTNDIYQIKNGQKVLINKIIACKTCTYHNKSTAHFCELCNGSLKK